MGLLVTVSLTSTISKTYYKDTIITKTDTVYVKQSKYEHLKYSFLFDVMKVENKESFIYELKALGARTEIPYEHFLGVFNPESGINPKAHNPTGAHGLWQITSICAKELGITKEELLNSDEYQQLIWFEQYLNFWGVDKISSYGDLYCVVYLPNMVTKDKAKIPKWVLKSNPSYSHCKTIGQFKLFVEHKYNEL
tara:strand:- start:1048 stop:1629 length:582 start_codon:yes stop_codon:yes gene_type:complete